MESAEMSSGEQAELFYRHFNNEVLRLEEQLGSLSLIAGNRDDHNEARTDAILQCAANVQRLKLEVHDASSFLPAHDQRRYGDEVKKLIDKLQTIRGTTISKNKFAFKSSRKAPSAASQPPPEISSSPIASSSATKPAEVETTEHDTSVDDGPYDIQLRQQAGPRIRKPSFTQAESISLTNHTHMHIILPASASHAMTTGKLTHLRSCIIDMSNPRKVTGTSLASLTIKHVSATLIITGDVAGPVHVTDLKNVVLVTSCRQLRMHDCINVNVYLSCASRPIIEDCSAIRFAPLPDVYAAADDEKTRPVVDRWDQVDDFKWLKAGPSPNWIVLPELERVEGIVWREVVPGSLRFGLKEIWKAVMPLP